jgi:hypothetical protein
MRFNDQSHIDNYKSKGQFPKIHDAIFKHIQEHVKKGDTVVEIGPCIGMLASRMIDKIGVKQVLGIEPNKNHLLRAVKKPEIRYFNMPVSLETMPKVSAIIKANKPSVIVGRRVFSEVAEYGGGPKAVTMLAYQAKKNGVKKIILEGRIIVKNPVVDLWSADLEAKAFAPYYKVTAEEGNVRVLEVVNE